MTKRILGIVTEDKDKGQGAKNAALTTHTLPTPATNFPTEKLVKIITTKDIRRKK